MALLTSYPEKCSYCWCVCVCVCSIWWKFLIQTSHNLLGKEQRTNRLVEVGKLFPSLFSNGTLLDCSMGSWPPKVVWWEESEVPTCPSGHRLPFRQAASAPLSPWGTWSSLGGQGCGEPWSRTLARTSRVSLVVRGAPASEVGRMRGISSQSREWGASVIISRAFLDHVNEPQRRKSWWK